MPKPKPDAVNRAVALAEQLANRSAAATAHPPSSTAMAQKRPPITCHVLDTTAGRPAASIPVSLTLLSPYGPSTPLSATTNGDGRVTGWAAPAGDPTTLEEIFHNIKAHEESGEHAEMVWALKFETRAYWEQRGVQAFFPEVEIKFVVRGRDEHYHVPLLLGPFNYTTYRGS
ncbi:5-hydroxyisourate hydrolase [Diplodia corticola]|uniref:hydroxyisourate hydrolase n=1 Tax=Diplodia corticola TaxID=236234 RepID=A0A1J9R0B0_9PEZI|nr:5-hydroxyisourate hydrolase [Diplodia corticola]OJD34806.1 5-hydroxyisourate hydrolase [Diplodia corticola]